MIKLHIVSFKQETGYALDDIKKELDGYESSDSKSGKDELDAFKRDSSILAEERKKQLKADSLKNMEYSGPSSVFYSLKGRQKMVLPIPVFKCEGGGDEEVGIGIIRWFGVFLRPLMH